MNVKRNRLVMEQRRRIDNFYFVKRLFESAARAEKDIFQSSQSFATEFGVCARIFGSRISAS